MLTFEDSSSAAPTVIIRRVKRVRTRTYTRPLRRANRRPRVVQELIANPHTGPPR